MQTPFFGQLFCSAFFITFMLTIGQAQTTSQSAGRQEAALKIKTELLQLRAVVTDKKGRVIEGLQADEFELLENNRPQKIEFFGREVVGGSNKQAGDAASKGENTVPSSPPLVPPTKPTCTIALFVDNVHVTFDSLDRTKQTLSKSRFGL